MSQPPRIHIPPALAAQAAREVAAWQLASDRYEVAAKAQLDARAELDRRERSMRECAKAIQMTATYVVAPAPSAITVAGAAHPSTPTLAAAPPISDDDAAAEVLAVMMAGSAGGMPQ